MDDRVELMINESDDSIVHFDQYIKARAKFTSPIFIFEGIDDPKFYISNITTFFGENYQVFSVGSKSNVLELRTMIRSNSLYSKDIVVFFVDRDFDDTKEEDDLYVTPTYSIENLYCQASTFKSIISAEYGLSNIHIDPEHRLRNELTEEFERLQQKFHNSKKVIFINALYMFVRTELHNKSISLDKIASIDMEFSNGNIKVKLTKKKEYLQLKGKYKKEFFNFIQSNPKWKEKLNRPSMFFRGKQEMIFLRKMLEELRDEKYFYLIAQRKIEQEQPEKKHKIKYKGSLISQDILSSISQYVTTPSCLRDFLVNFQQKANEVAIA